MTFSYRLVTDTGVSAGALSRVWARVAAAPGQNTTGAVNVDTATGGNQNFGWKTGTAIFTGLASGTMTIQVGITGTNNTAGGGPAANCDFDNILVEPLNNTGVLANDTGGAISAILNTSPLNGALVFNANGTFTYTPAANYAGSDSFTYRASDGVDNSNVATVALTITAVNDVPVATNDSYVTTENVTLNVAVAQGVLLNDTDVEGTTLTSTILAQALHGTVTLQTNGSFTYVPVAGYSGPDSFTYRASDGVANSNTATVAITLNPVNDPPVAVNDTYSAIKNQALVITAATGGTASETLIAAGANWRYLDNGTNQGTAWRALGFADGALPWKGGLAELGYGDIPDGRPEATVVEDDATPGSPTAGSTTRYWTTYFRHTFTVTNKATLSALVLNVIRDDGAVVYLNGTVISNTTMHNGLTSNPAYTDAAANAPTAEEFTFLTANLVNAEALLNEGSNVIAVEIHQSTQASSDISFNLSLTATRTTQAGVLANDTEPDGQTMTATVVTAPIHGALSLNANGTFTYTPAANYTGPDSFVYSASDGSFSANATASITISSAGNSAPVAVNDSYTATEDTVLNVPQATGVLLNDTDSDTDPLTANIVTQPAFGAVVLAANGSFTYTPVANYNGPDSFTYRAFDGVANSIAATVSITVNGTPDAPVAVGESYATDRGVALVVNAPGVLANDTDPDGQTLTAQLVANPASGTLALNANGSFTYTPTPTFSGAVNFTYRASDGALTSSVATVTISVNSAPVAAADSYAATEDTTLNVPATGVLANDSDPDGEPITAVLVTNAANGTVTLNANGSFTYVPAANFAGPDTFTYRATDGTRNSANVTVTINVAGVNDVPVAVNDTYGLPIGEVSTVSAALGVLANDIDVDAPTLTAQLLTSPASGTLIWSGNGSFTYTPAPGFMGSVSFTYKASDGTSLSAVATVTLNVENQAAIAISEIMFNATGGLPTQEWIEVRNTGATSVNLRGWQFTKGVNFTFPDTTLAAGAALVVAANVPAFQALYPAVTNVTGPWDGGLGNSGEQIQIDNALGKKIDEVNYADQGDWADRRVETLGGQNGWAWISGADGTGQSLQLRNPLLSHDNGQNWRSATPTPGAANTGVASTNLAPLVFDVKHSPHLPTPSQQVHVTASFADESLAAPTAKVTYRTWTRPALADTTSTPTAWVDSPMADDGLHGDGAAGDGKYGATIPSFTANTIVEFYVHVTDGLNIRTWPAPTDTGGTQGANCLYYVETPESPGTRPFYRLVMNGQDEINFRFANWPSASDAALNITFIAQQGADTDVRYSADLRIRGASSRDRNPRGWRVNIPHDDSWNGRVSMNLNTQYIYNQVMGSRLMELAGLPREEATVVQLRLNGLNHATDNQNNRRFSHYIDIKPLGSDFVNEQYPNDSAGNAYHKVRPDTKWAPRGAVGVPTVASYLADGWSKETNATINDWTDLHALLRAFTDTPAGATYYPTISAVADVDQFARWFALCTILNHRETNISNGTDDDYSMYRGVIDPRFKLIGHDFDTVFNIGDTTTSPTAGIYQVIDSFGGTTMPVFTNFFQDNTIARKYKAQLRELLTTVFTKPNFDATVDNLLATDWIPAPHGQATSDVPENLQTYIKTFMDTRRAHILTLLPQAFTAATSLGVQNGFPTTTTATASGLTGNMDAARTAKVTVNGVTVTQSNYAGTWTTGTAVVLKPGLNTLICKAWDQANVEIATTSLQVVYDDGGAATKGGTLAADETWTVAGGPYSVTSNLTVPSGVTLTIQPGTSVFFGTGIGFTVAAGGRVLAEGTADAPITFSKAPAGTGTWSGLVINGGAGSPETRISYGIFENNAAVAIHTQNGARVVFDRLTFKNTAQPYLSLDGSSFVVSNTIFPTATAAFELVHGTGGIAAGGEGIIRDCWFGVANGYNDVVDFTGGNRPGPILQVLNNVFTGSGDDILDLDGTDAWVEGNLFMHAHKSAASPDSSSAVSGGLNASDLSQVTVIRNLIYDCDQAVTMKEGNSFALLQNTIAHITKTGGTDTASGVVNFFDPGTDEGAGAVIEGNIIWDVEALTRNYNAGVSTVTFTNNLLPTAWAGPGSGNTVADPMLNLTLITTPGTATEAQVRAALIPQVCSLAIGTGILGRDKGALIPAGVAIGGIPASPTPGSGATLSVGPSGVFGGTYAYGYTHYRYSLDGGALSAETPVATPISLSGLGSGVHTVSVIGKNDAAVWQTTPTVATWTVNPGAVTVVISEVLANNLNAYIVGTTRPDVIELHNYGTSSVDLTNYSITDNAGSPRKYVLTSGTTIPAGGYLVLLADAFSANPGTHLGFSLDADGATVGLYGPNAVVGSTPVDSVTFGAQVADLSIARVGVARTWMLSTLTVGTANTTVCVLGDPAALRINEWLSANLLIVANDFLELFNPGLQPVALGGLHLTDDLGNYPFEHTIAPLSFIGAGGFVKYIADGDTSQGVNHLSFSISSVHETLALTSATGLVLDEVPVVSQIEDQSQGRITDGAATFAFFSLPTPGYSNGAYSGAQTTAFQALIANLRVTELMFQPDTSGRAEFVEFKNISATATLDLSGVIFGSGLSHTFPGGTTLAPGAYLVVTEHLAKFQSQFPAVPATQWTSGKLDNNGERIRIEISPYDLGIMDFDYSDNWYPITAGGGASLQIIDPLQPRTTWSDKASWQPSSVPNPGGPPVFAASAGPDLIVQPGFSAVLNGDIVYGPFPSNTVSFAWTKISGPGTVTFTAPSGLDTDAAFSLPGVYVLRLAATESGASTSVNDTVQIIATEAYAAWSVRTISNPALRAEGLDADNDGNTNLVEFASGLNPQVYNPSPTTLGSEAGFLTLTYQRDLAMGGLTYLVQESSNVIAWTSANVTEELLAVAGTVQTIKARVPLALGDRQFLRLNIAKF